MELYPRIGAFDLKTWTNCSMGMMSWAVLPLCFAVKQYETQGYVSNSMLVSAILQQIYVFKFFLCVDTVASRVLLLRRGQTLPNEGFTHTLPVYSIAIKVADHCRLANKCSTFRWESGYWCTMDIAHDRAGYYLCWGCLVWVPSIYTSPALYLVKHPINLHPLLATAFFVAGMRLFD